jgi:hypothetical protein
MGEALLLWNLDGIVLRERLKSSEIANRVPRRERRHPIVKSVTSYSHGREKKFRVTIRTYSASNG